MMIWELGVDGLTLDTYQGLTHYKANTTLNSFNLFLPWYPIRLIQMRTHGSVGRTIQAKSLTHGIAQTFLIGQRPIPPSYTQFALHFNLCKSDRIGSKGTEDRQRQETETDSSERERERERASETRWCFIQFVWLIPKGTIVEYPYRWMDTESMRILYSGCWFAPTNQLLSTNWHQLAPIEINWPLSSPIDYPKKTDKATYCVIVQVHP